MSRPYRNYYSGSYQFKDMHRTNYNYQNYASPTMRLRNSKYNTYGSQFNDGWHQGYKNYYNTDDGGEFNRPYRNTAYRRERWDTKNMNKYLPNDSNENTAYNYNQDLNHNASHISKKCEIGKIASEDISASSKTCSSSGSYRDKQSSSKDTGSKANKNLNGEKKLSGLDLSEGSEIKKSKLFDTQDAQNNKSANIVKTKKDLEKKKSCTVANSNKNSPVTKSIPAVLNHKNADNLKNAENVGISVSDQKKVNLSNVKKGKEQITAETRHLFFLSSDSDDEVNKVSESHGLSEKSYSQSNVLNKKNIALNSKIKTWSKILEASKSKISASNKEILNKLINFPCSHNEQVKFKCFLQKYAKKKRKLTFPRFNMELKDAEPSKSSDSNQDISHIVGEAVEDLPEDVLSSLFDILVSDNDDSPCIQDVIPDSTSDSNIRSPTSSGFFSLLKKTKPYDSSEVSSTEIEKELCTLFTVGDAKSDKSTDSSCSQKRKLSGDLSLHIPKKLQLTSNYEKNSCYLSQSTNQRQFVHPKTSACSSNTSETNIFKTPSASGSFIKEKNNTNFFETTGKFSGNVNESTNTLMNVVIKEEPKSPTGSVTFEDYGNSAAFRSSSTESHEVSGGKDHSQHDQTFASSTESFVSVNSNAGFSTMSQLMELFAKGAVKVKNEFSDPAIDAINNVDLTAFNNALSGVSIAPQTDVVNDTQISPDSVHSTSSCSVANIAIKQEAIDNDPDSIHTSCVPSVMMPYGSDKRSVVINSSDKNDITDSQNEVDSSFSSQCQNLLSTGDQPLITQDLISKLIKITAREEGIQKECEEVDRLILKLSAELDDLKNKKIKLLHEEAKLRADRMLVLHSLQDTLTPENSSNELRNIVCDNKANKENHDLEKNKTPNKRSPKKNVKTNSTTISTSSVSPVGNGSKSTKSPSRAKKDQNNCSPQQASKLRRSPRSVTKKSSNSKTPNKKNAQNNLKNSSFELITAAVQNESNTMSCFKSPKQKLEKIVPFKNQNSSVTDLNSVKIGRLEAHNVSVTDLIVLDGYLYTCSSDRTAKRFKLDDSSESVIYSGHSKTVTALYARATDTGVHLYTSSNDGFLRCFYAHSGILRSKTNLKTPILCMCEGWGILYLGLRTGEVSLYSLSMGIPLESLRCAKSSVSCIATTTQGAQHLLCVATYDCVVTIWDASTQLLLRCLEHCAKPPCFIKMYDNFVFVSTAEKTLIAHELLSGQLQYVINFPTTATGLAIIDEFIVACSYDGLVRVYNRRCNGSLLCQYYGAGKTAVMCMTTCGKWVFTGNRSGVVEAFMFNASKIVFCKFGFCENRFGRPEDLKHHVQCEHLQNLNKKLLQCPWRSCDSNFSSTLSEQERKNHISQHCNENLDIF